MLSAETTEYYNNWMAHLVTITGDQPADHFARFKILYSVQNRLYSDASADLFLSGFIPSRGGNKKEATTNMVHYLGAANMLQGLHDNGNDLDIQHLIGIMENKVFNITLSPQGVPQLAHDAALLDGLRSADQTEKALAIATFVYQVRCNDTHGEKAIDHIQPLLLEPVNNILLTLIQILHKALSKRE